MSTAHEEPIQKNEMDFQEHRELVKFIDWDKSKGSH